MNPRLRHGLILSVAAVLSVWLAWDIAEGAYAWPILAFGIAAAAILVRLTHVSFDVIVLGLALAGYLVGNRGFAQLMPLPGLPLLPAEMALGLALTWRVVLWAFARKLPLRARLVDGALLAWIALGTVRVAFDVRSFGFAAIRDYATVYYGLFFLLVRHMAEQDRARAFLRGCLLAGFLLLPLAFAASLAFPDAVARVAVNGVPLLFFKGDLVMTMFGAGALLLAHLAGGRGRGWVLPFAVLLCLAVAANDNRASQAGLAVACAGLVAARRWRFPALVGAACALALLVLVGTAAFTQNAWARDRLQGVNDRLHSLADFTGGGRYSSQENAYKSDNNRFRFVWWRTVVDETWRTNPVFGLGFGYDLARGFIQEYSPEASEEFTARSPHNVFLTMFGRMGAAGLAVWLVLVAALAREAWRAFRRPDPEAWGLWSAAAVILVSASLGVVLEGPMGAMPFWTLLALADSRRPEASAPTAAPADPA